MADWTERGYGRARMQKLMSAGPQAEAAAEGGLEGPAGPPRGRDAALIAQRLAAGPAKNVSQVELEGIARQIVDTAAKGLQKLDGAAAGPLTAEETASLEAVVHVRGRPSARVLGDALEDLRAFPEAERWAVLYEAHENRVITATSATAAVTVTDRLLPQLSWVQGSAVLIGDGLALTNRHVLLPTNGATRLARRRPGGPGGKLKRHYKVELDFAFDSGPRRDLRYEVTDIPFVAADDDPVDAAIVAISPAGSAANPQLDISGEDILDLDRLFVVGHPGRLSTVPDDVQLVFGEPDERKRVSFGEVMDGDTVDGVHIVHDASTIGGFSGGPVLGFGSTDVMALHYWGDGVNGNRAIASGALRAHPGIVAVLDA